MRPRAILSILVCTCGAQSVQAGGRRVEEDTGGPICLSHQGAWLDRCPGVGQVGPKGLWASAMPLFLYKGPLTCTSPECGTLLGPSVCVGTGNLQATGSLQGWCSPSTLVALVAAGLMGWWWAWLCMCDWHCSFLWVHVPQGQARPLQATAHMGECGPSGDPPTKARL